MGPDVSQCMRNLAEEKNDNKITSSFVLTTLVIPSEARNLLLLAPCHSSSFRARRTFGQPCVPYSSDYIMSTRLETRRLILRGFEDADIPDIVRLAGVREIAATTLRIPHPYSHADAEKFVSYARQDRRASFAIVLKDTGQLCGALGLELDAPNQRAELGYWIGVPYWGRGYATEAACAVVQHGFEVLKLNRIYAFHFSQNPASGRVLQKIGMRHEGRQRGHVYKWGRFVDLEMYGLLRSEWTAPRS
jgi:RimJ/RimL family protein N-acetyltransferase